MSLTASKAGENILMFDNFLPIPDADSLPFYLLVLKLVVCVLNNIDDAPGP